MKPIFEMDQAKLHNCIALLTQLHGCKDNRQEFLEQLNKNVEKVLRVLQSCEELKFKIDQTDKVTLKFVLTSLHVLKLLSTLTADDFPSNLISLQQQQKIKMLLQMIFSLGLTPTLFQGVNTALKNRTSQLFLSHLEEMTVIESYTMMSEIVKSLVQILRAPNLRSLVLAHLGDLMAALLQLIYKGEFKKPVKDVEVENKNSQDFIMTEQWYNKLMEDRNEFKIMYQELVDNIYKPLAIRELLILLSPLRSIENGDTVTPPPWLRKAVSSQLTGYLLGPGGVSLIMRAMCESNTDVVDWKKVEAIAKLISIVHGNFSDNDFYSIISPQIITMLNTTGPYCIPVAKKCIKNIYKHNIDICQKYIFDKLFEPFIICSMSVAENFSGTIVSEDSLSRCIVHLTECFSPGSKSSLPMSVLIKIIKILYELYMKVASSPYHLTSAIQDLLLEFFYSEKDIKKLKTIYNALIFNEPHEEILEMNEELEFQFGPGGGVQVGKRVVNDYLPFPGPEYELEFEITGDHFLILLSHREEYAKKLLSDLFVILLSALSDFNESQIEVPNTNTDLLCIEEVIMYLVRISQKRMVTVKLLADLAENVHVMESIQGNPEVVFKFIENLIQSKAQDILRDREINRTRADSPNYEKEEESEDSKKEDIEDLFVLLAVIDLMTINVKFSSYRWDMCKSLLNSIEIIKNNCEDSFIKYFANLLFNRIVTRGAVSGSKKPQTRFNSDSYDFNKSDCKHICGNDNSENKENLDDTALKLANKKRKKKKKLIVEVGTDGKEKSELDLVLEEVCSNDIPTRGHALIQLAKLIRKMDSDTMARKDRVFAILKCNLTHEDTYIYLSAINCLEALALVVEADKILELLCEEYTENKKDFSDLQLKIGEVLLRITKALGELVPKYKALLTNTFLFGAKSKDEFLRVSSLSNLGELVKMLGCDFGNVLQEVFICIESIVLTDKSDMARRAAVMVVQLLLKGMSPKNIMLLEPVIRDLYKTIRHIYHTDRDEIARLHAELALAEINRIVKSSFDKEVKLEKRIGILDLHL